MNSENCFIAAGVLGMMFSCTNRQGAESKKPNVILIMTDDQGYGELSFHGNPILKTPNIDSLARQSIRFNDFHVAPMSTPTRGQLMTGLDAVRNGAVNVSSGRTLLRPELKTMADIFGENGYSTGIFGKWHLGDNYPYTPENRGFQETLWFPSSHVGSVPDYWGNDYFDDTYIHNGKREAYKGFCTDVFFEEAMQFITTSSRRDKPFFVYLPTNAPHSPFNAREEDIEVLEEAYAESSFAGKEFNRKHNLIRYLAMIHNIDVNIGILRDFLRKEKLDKNTVLVFLTDNGSTFAPYYYPAGMKGMKTQLWEGGHRVPLFIHYPEGNFTGPRDVNGLTQVQDILPTLADLCELRKPENFKSDGISLVPQLSKNIDAPDDRMIVINFSRMPGFFDYPSPAAPSVLRKEGAAVCWKRWRLLDNRELYNLEDDPLQERNVIEEYPEVAGKMRKHLDMWWNSVGNSANELQRVVIGSEVENPVMITACEWPDVFVDMQIQIQNGVRKNGYWLLQVEEPGKYEFELRRWPREANIPLSESENNFKKLPITSARIYIDFSNGSDSPVKSPAITQLVELKPEDYAAVFTFELEKGPATLHTWFNDREQQMLCGAYYLYVKRL